MLKPGAPIALYEWVMTEAFSATEPAHVAIRQHIERGNGIVSLTTIPEALAAWRGAGLELTASSDEALRSPDRPWWFPLDGDTGRTVCARDWWRVFKLKKPVWRAAWAMTWCLQSVGLHYPHAAEAVRTLGESVEGLRDGGRAGIFTPSFLMVGRKPVEGWTSRKSEGKGQVGSEAHGATAAGGAVDAETLAERSLQME